MKKKSKIIVISIIAVIVLIATLIIINVNKNKDKSLNSDNTNTPGIDENGNVDTNSIQQVFFPLKKGSKNDYVLALQLRLLNEGAKLPVYGADGEFGSETESACLQTYGVSQVTYSKFVEIFS